MLEFRLQIYLFILYTIGKLDTIKAIKNFKENDLVASASKSTRNGKFLSSGGCFECNRIPWTPITGRSLNFPSSSLHYQHNHQPYLREKNSHYNPPSDFYGAPQGQYNLPSSGEVVDFMLPPKFQLYNNPSKVSSYGGPPDASYYYSAPNPSYPPPTSYNGIPNPSHFPPKQILNLVPPPLQNNQHHHQYLRPSSVSQNFQPPPVGILPLDNNLPPVQPSDSYGRPLGDSFGAPSSSFIDTLPLGSEENFIHQHQFAVNNNNDVQIVPSINLAAYTHSIEHPIKIIQSPIVDLDVKDDKISENNAGNLSENPIFVDDPLFTSASNLNATFSSDFLLKQRTNDKFYLPNRNNYLNNKTNTFQANNLNKKSQDKKFKKLNEIQMTVPYLNPLHEGYTTLAPVFVPPPSSTSSSTIWQKIAENLQMIETHKEVAEGFHRQTPTSTADIKKSFYDPSYRMLELQKNIDHWTQQTYSSHNSPISKFRNKTFVKEFSYSSTTPSDIYLLDHEVSSSDKKEVFSKEIQDNLIDSDDENEYHKSFNKEKKISNKIPLKNSTHEKIVIVTPQNNFFRPTSSSAAAFSMAPKVENGNINHNPTITKFKVQEETNSMGVSGNSKIVYSEWPHLINDLATTTSTVRSTSRHPLFGLMDLAPFTESPKITKNVETFAGHSKVVSTGTSPNNQLISTTPSVINKTIKILPTVYVNK